LALSIVLSTVAVGATVAAPGICRHPPPADYSRNDVLTSMPHYRSSLVEPFQVDVRSADLSAVNPAELSLTDLFHADFDSRTIWPNPLPESFDPERVMEFGRDPGLNVRRLHAAGVTGDGVAVAIIDQTLLVDHQEYADRVRVYEELDAAETAAMHGAAVASIALGKTVGVAPGADLYYIAALGQSNSPLAEAIDRVVEINRGLPRDSKIRVLSISVALEYTQEDPARVMVAAERAKAEGIFVISSSLRQVYRNWRFHGLGRFPLDDPNDSGSYGPGLFWAQQAYEMQPDLGTESRLEGMALTYGKPLLIPMDSRCVASPTGTEDYVFYREGGWSWSIPYIAGLYALACQVQPSVTPPKFWAAALDTGDPLVIETKSGPETEIGRIVDPVALIERLAGENLVPGLGGEPVSWSHVVWAFLPLIAGLAVAGCVVWLVRRTPKKLKAPPPAGGAPNPR